MIEVVPIATESRNRLLYTYMIIFVVGVLVFVWLNDSLERKRFSSMEARLRKMMKEVAENAVINRAGGWLDQPEADEDNTLESIATDEDRGGERTEGDIPDFQFTPIYLGTQLKVVPMRSLQDMPRFRVIDAKGNYVEVIADHAAVLDPKKSIHIRLFSEKEGKITYREEYSFEHESNLGSRVRVLLSDLQKNESV